MSAIITVKGLQVRYGMIEAVKGIDLTIEEGEITALLGANGAGKTTTLLTFSGLIKPAAGSIRFDQTDLTRLAPHEIVACGMVQVPEGREILTTLTVRENLLLGAHRRHDRSAVDEDMDYMLCTFPRLRERLDGAAGNLSGGEQQMLAIARALMAKPRVLLLDEPSMGLAPLLAQEIFHTLGVLNRAGLTIFLVEQNARQALKIAQRACVMENGRIALTGTSAALLQDEKIVAAYLGE
jgi:branched-chain amino acid transport system ATP-binding protein